MFSFSFTGAGELLRKAADRQRQAYRPGMRANVRSHALLYVAFTQSFGFTDFPATERVLLAFAEFLVRTFTAPKSVLNALSSVRHFHLDHGWPILAFEARSLMLWRRALPLTLWYVPHRAPPLRLGLLEQLCNFSSWLGQPGIVLTALMAFLFVSMARLSSLVASSPFSFDATRLPTLADVVFREGGWNLRMKWAKNFQDAADGFWVPLLPLLAGLTTGQAGPSQGGSTILVRVEEQGQGGSHPTPHTSFGQGVASIHSTQTGAPGARLLLPLLSQGGLYDSLRARGFRGGYPFTGGMLSSARREQEEGGKGAAQHFFTN